VTKEVLALALTLFVHVVGMLALIWALFLDDDDNRPDWRGWFRLDDDTPPEPQRGPSGDLLPLPDAKPSRVRLREPGRAADLLPRPPRRPAHAPDRAPQRTPERGL
jgi:hypothetical protein